MRPRNPASGERWDFIPGNLSHAARFSEILICFYNLECAGFSFFPLRAVDLLPHESSWGDFTFSSSTFSSHSYHVLTDNSLCLP